MDRDRFLVEVYTGSGNQINNNNSVLGSYMGFYAVGLAAFVGLLSQAQDDLNRAIWVLPMALSAYGLLLTLSLQRYIHAALNRRQAIEEHFIDNAEDRRRLRVGRGPGGIKAWAINHRQDFLLGGPFLIGLSISVWFTLFGDPFSFADGCLNFPKVCR